MALSADTKRRLTVGLTSQAASDEIVAVLDGDVALAAGQISVGNAQGIATDVAVSGDATLSSAGALTITLFAGVVAGVVSASKALIADAQGALSGLLIKLGAATTVQSPPVAGIAPDVSVNASGTTQNQFYDLNTVTIPANAMSANGKGFQFVFMGTTAANANAKDFRLAFGGSNTTLATGLTGSGVAYYCSGAIYRTGVGAQILVAEITVGNAAPFPVCVALSQDETTALALKIQSQNTAAAAASATGKGAVVWFSN